MDFTDLNKVCPKDSFFLPKIDKFMDFKVGLEFLRFLDVNSGYHQIPMYLEDEEELFATGQMLFGLKNTEATH